MKKRVFHDLKNMNFNTQPSKKSTLFDPDIEINKIFETSPRENNKKSKFSPNDEGDISQQHRKFNLGPESFT